jgi:hypothetical protein
LAHFFLLSAAAGGGGFAPAGIGTFKVVCGMLPSLVKAVRLPVVFLISVIRWFVLIAYLCLTLGAVDLVEDGAGGGGLAPVGIGIFSVVRGMLPPFATKGRPDSPDFVDVIQ